MENNIVENNFLIIDGNSIMNRAFYGIKILSTKDGLYTNAIYGFLNIYYMMKEKLNPKFVSVAFDLSTPTFRHKMYSEYKAGRHAMPQELKSQMPQIKEVLNAMNIPILEKDGYEADDIIGTISSTNATEGIHTYILTGDRDSFQLISDHTTVILPTTKFGKTEYTYYTPELLYEKYSILPTQVPDVKALMGDSSDNIIGVPGIGEKTAYPLINKYGSIEKIYENVRSIEATPSVIAKLENNEESARQSKILATIEKNVPLDIDYKKFELKQENIPELIKLFTRFEFKKFIEKYAKNTDVTVATDVSKEFFDKLKNSNFYLIETKQDMEYIHKIQGTMAITFIDKLQDNSELLCIKAENNIYIVKDMMLKEVLEYICTSEYIKITYDLKKIERTAFSLGITTFNNFVADILLEYYLLNVSENNYSIENISYNTLDVPAPEISKANQNVQTTLFDIMDTAKELLTDENKKYIYYVLNGILEIHSKLYSDLKDNNLLELFQNIEMPLIEVLANMEYNGMYVDKNKLKIFGEEITGRIEEITKRIYEISGQEFNINSPQQLGNILFNVLEIPYPKKTKTNYSTDKETLESIKEEYEIIDLVLEYRMLSKLRSTYVDALMEVIQPDGRIHTTFMQTTTVTGRLSSVEPNLQNIPVKTDLGSKIRDCFISENGNVIVDADYSQIELRVLAHMSQDKELVKGFNEDLDIHTITASQVFDVPQEQVTKELRSKAKAVNFGIVYGISEYGLAKNIHSTRTEAAKYITNYLKHYVGIDTYMKDVIEKAKEEGYVQTIYGRKRTVPELKSANFLTRNFGERIAMNMPIQGTAADIMKLAMIKTYNSLKETNLKAKLIMQVHDELLIEAPEEETQKVIEILKNAMENASKLSVPLKADVNVGKTWLEAK